MIPKIIHYVWVGGSIPAKLQRYIDSWSEHNPDYRIVPWTEDNIDFSVPAIRTAYRQRRWARVSDIVRLMAVHRHGGIYLDTDFLVIRRLDSVLHHRCFAAFQTEHPNTDWIANGAFGAEPGHWFVAEALEAALSLMPIPFGLDRPTRSGPRLLTRLLRRHGLCRYDPAGVQVSDVFLYPAPVFYPYFWTENFTEECIQPATLAVHHWEKAWAKDVPLMVRFVKSMRTQLAGRA